MLDLPKDDSGSRRTSTPPYCWRARVLHRRVVIPARGRQHDDAVPPPGHLDRRVMNVLAHAGGIGHIHLTDDQESW